MEDNKLTFTELAEKRYSVRSFTSEHLPEQVIQKILHAGNVAPTGCNNQPQRILVLNTDDSIEKLKDCTKCHFNAPCAMLVCYNKDQSWYRPYDNAPCGPMDASIVTTHLMLQATELGVGTTWVMHFNPQKMRDTFAIPQNIEPVALLVMGYPSKDAKAFDGHNTFRPQEEIIVRDHF